MLSANKEKLQSFFMGSNQFRIPFFQRAYVWKNENWAELWDNVIEELTELKNNTGSEHFIGTIIIKQTESERLGALVYDLIDGQQRLTTVCLILRALHDITDDKNLQNWINSLLVFVDSYGNKNIRILHSKVDREYFQNLILSEDDNSDIDASKSRIEECYVFFRKRIKSEIDPGDIRNVVTILLEKLPVIHMALSKEDDVQQIFDTINSLGVKLTTGELLKNYLFSSAAMEPHYHSLWHTVFEADEDAILFWEKIKTSGRVPRPTIELFLYSYLVIIKENAIKIESLFKEYKQHLKDKSAEQLIDFAKELHQYARLYEKLPEGENIADIAFNEHEKRFFHLMNEFDITTVFPLVLFIYKNTKGDEQEKILRCLESYLVRRTICKLTTKNYNNLFISILVELKKMPAFTAGDFRNKLTSYTEDTNRFPDDEEFESAFYSRHLINQYSKEILYCIALYDLNHHYQDNRRLNNSGFSVEHIMPKKWRNHWNIDVGADEYDRDSLLLTLGNLTLVQGRLNSSMRDSAWNDKKEALTEYSTLKLTTDYLDIEDWNETEIDSRARDLYQKALLIWKR